MLNIANEIIYKIKKENPLILNITNDVTIDFVANGLLSLGASPVMSSAKQEIDDLIQLSRAVVINLGTLNQDFNELCHHVCSVANQQRKPIILDPVGAGASNYRTETCNALLSKYCISIIRANAGEVMALAGLQAQTKGVDSQVSSIDSIKFAETLSSQYGLAVCMSGKIDVIVDQDKKIQFDRGSPLMPMITGTGCLLSAVVGAFHAVHENRFEAAAAASLFYSVCGEHAAKKSSGPGSFKANFLDILNVIPEENFYERKS